MSQPQGTRGAWGRERRHESLALATLLAIGVGAIAVVVAAVPRESSAAPRETAAPSRETAAPSRESSPASAEDRWAVQRRALVEELRRQGIADGAVLAAMVRVPRHEFVPEAWRDQSYRNHPLPIGEGQTISQPYIVALMTEAARVSPRSNVLEVGTGSGYQAAILADILGLGPGAGEASGRLASIEIVPSLAERAKATLARLGYRADVRVGDGYAGWPEKAPFDAILVTAAPDHVPEPLKQQLAPGGRLVIPVGDDGATQQLLVITRTEKGFREETILPVRFVPMTGEAQRGR